jgi:hypothetical protein
MNAPEGPTGRGVFRVDSWTQPPRKTDLGYRRPKLVARLTWPRVDPAKDNWWRRGLRQARAKMPERPQAREAAWSGPPMRRANLLGPPLREAGPFGGDPTCFRSASGLAGQAPPPLRFADATPCRKVAQQVLSGIACTRKAQLPILVARRACIWTSNRPDVAPAVLRLKDGCARTTISQMSAEDGSLRYVC